MARAAARDAPISVKTSVEIAKWLRGAMSDKAERSLKEVIALRRAVPFTRACDHVGHRRGHLGPGKYPVKAASVFLALLTQCVANAESKGLGTPLKIVHLAAQQAATPAHYGRQRGLVMKRAHVELVLAETEESKRREKREKRVKKEGKKDSEKKDAKPVVEEKPPVKADVNVKETTMPNEEKTPVASQPVAAKPVTAKPATPKPKAESLKKAEKKPEPKQ